MTRTRMISTYDLIPKQSFWLDRHYIDHVVATSLGAWHDSRSV